MNANPREPRARSAWAAAIGEANVLADEASRAAAALTTFALARSVLAILRPGSAAEVQACVRIANHHRVPLYPVSAGKNWGLGSRVPSADDCVLLDLSRLDRIVDFDERLAYLTVEPGVTFRQAHQFLRERKSKLYLSAIGGPDTASLIGNALERGDGNGPYSDRALYACAAQLVLPDGEILDTGFARYPKSPVAPLARWGVGPNLDGLFSQSNLGVVTRMTFWLAPAPEYFAQLLAVVEDTGRLEPFIEALRPLMLREIIRPGLIGIWNAYKTLASVGRYPWAATGGMTPLGLAQATESGGEPWYASGTLLAWSEQQYQALYALTHDSLSPNCRQLILMYAEAGPSADSAPLGIPGMETVASVYWRKKTDAPKDPDPDRDRCGVLWVCPLLPFDGAQVARAMSGFESVYAQFGFEPNLGMTPVTARSLHGYLAILYDRDVPGEDERAMACHDRLLELALELGCPPYRLGIQSMSKVPGGQVRYVRMLRELKRLLDPNDVLAPGRYDWRHDWPDE